MNEAKKIDNQQGNGVLPCVGGSFFIDIDDFGEASQYHLGFNEYDKCQTLRYKLSWQSGGDSNNFGNKHISYAEIDLPEGRYEIKNTSPKKVELMRVF